MSERGAVVSAAASWPPSSAAPRRFFDSFFVSCSRSFWAQRKARRALRPAAPPCSPKQREKPGGRTHLADVARARDLGADDRLFVARFHARPPPPHRVRPPAHVALPAARNLLHAHVGIGAQARRAHDREFIGFVVVGHPSSSSAAGFLFSIRAFVCWCVCVAWEGASKKMIRLKGTKRMRVRFSGSAWRRRRRFLSA